MFVSSRTPEGQPNRCSVCGAEVRIDPSFPIGDAPCPDCGQLLWFSNHSITVVQFAVDEEMDQSTGQQLLDLVKSLLSPRLLLDFQNVSFLSSAMIARLVLLNEEITTRGGKLLLINVNPNVYEVFKITKLHRRFEICADESEPIEASLQRSGWFSTPRRDPADGG